MEEVTKDLVAFGESQGKKGIEIYEYVLDMDTKNLVRKLDSKIFQRVREARKKRNTKWLQENLVFDRVKYDKQYKERLESVTKLHKGNTVLVNKDMNAFAKEYDPNVNETAWLNFKNSNWKAKDEEANYSDKWRFIMNNPPVEAYYNVVSSIIKEMQDYTRGKQPIPDNFIPNVMMDLIDTFAKDNVFTKDAIEKIGMVIYKKFEIRDTDTTFGETLNGKNIDTVPLPFFDIMVGDVDNKSTDINKSVLMGAFAARHYAEIQAIEGVAISLRKAMASTKLLRSPGIIRGTRWTSNAAAKEYLDSGEESKLVKEMDTWINYYIYGRKLVSKESNSERKFRKGIESVKSIHSKANLFFNTASALAGYVNSVSQQLQLAAGGRYIDRASIAKAQKMRFSNRAEALLMYEFMNLESGGSQSLMFEKANKISTSSLRRKFAKEPGYFMQRGFDDATDMDVMLGLAQNYMLHPNGRDVIQKDELSWRFKGTKWQGTEFKSILDSFKLADNSDGEVPFTFEYANRKNMSKEQYINFRNKIKYVAGIAKGNMNKEDIAGYKTSTLVGLLMHYKGWLPAMALERFKNPKYNYTTEEIEIGRFRVVVGEMIAKGLIPSLKRTAELLLTSTGDLITFNKLGLTKPNEGIARMSFERWRLGNPGHYEAALEKYGHLPRAEGQELLFQSWMKARNGQLHAAIAEARAYIMAVMAMVAVGMAFGDDDDERNPLVDQMLRHLDRLGMELGFFMIPGEMQKIVTRGPIPILSIISDVSKLVGNTVGETIDLVTFTEPGKKLDIVSLGDEPWTLDFFKTVTDKTNKFHYTFKLTPYMNGLNRLFEFTDEGGKSLIDWLGEEKFVK